MGGFPNVRVGLQEDREMETESEIVSRRDLLTSDLDDRTPLTSGTNKGFCDRFGGCCIVGVFVGTLVTLAILFIVGIVLRAQLPDQTSGDVLMSVSGGVLIFIFVVLGVWVWSSKDRTRNKDDVMRSGTKIRRGYMRTKEEGM